MNKIDMHIENEIELGEGKPVHGVTFDGDHLWLASGDALHAVDPNSGERVRELPVACDAGTAFDGEFLYQLAEDRIQKVNPTDGAVVHEIPAPGKGKDSGLTWAEGKLWVGQWRDRKIHLIDPESGAVIRTIESDRFVTGVTWVADELWHGSHEGDVCELRQIDPQTGEVLRALSAPEGVSASGLTSDGERLFFGGGRDGKVRVVRRPKV